MHLPSISPSFSSTSQSPDVFAGFCVFSTHHYCSSALLHQPQKWDTVIVNFLCRLNRARVGRRYWSDVIWGVSVRVLLDEINIEISRLDEVYCPQ